MLVGLVSSLRRCIQFLARQAQRAISSYLKPTTPTIGSASDVVRSRSELVIENALLRHQLIVLKRQVKRPTFTSMDRLVMLWLTSRLRGWQQALLLVKPATVLRWHRELFKWLWRRKSQHTGGKAPLSPALVALVQQMARENSLWGAERIRGELLKLGIHVSKSTIQRYLPKRTRAPSSQTWTTFLHSHAQEIWACDFIQVTDWRFRAVFVFVMLELGSRRVLHVGVTRHPTDAWVAQQIRESTPFGQQPRFLVRDNDSKYGRHVQAVTQDAGIKVLRTPIAAPRANATCERFIGSVRRECLDHHLIKSGSNSPQLAARL